MRNATETRKVTLSKAETEAKILSSMTKRLKEEAEKNKAKYPSKEDKLLRTVLLQNFFLENLCSSRLKQEVKVYRQALNNMSDI